MSHGRFYGEARHTWKEAVLKYAEEVLPQSVKPGSAKRYLCSLTQVDPYLADLYVDQIDTKVIAKIAARKGVSNATRRRDMTAVSSVLRACCQWGWREDNPARTFDRSIIRERRDPTVLPPDEDIQAVLEEAPDMLSRMIRTAWKTGMRQEEIVGLRRPQVCPQEAAIYLGQTKTDEARVIPLDDPVCREAVGTITGTPVRLGCPYVFWHGEGLRFRNVSSNFAQVRRRVNRKREESQEALVTFRFHDLRHRFAVDYLKATRSQQMRRGDVYRLAEILGHSSVKTTEGYLKHVPPLGTKPAQTATVSAQEIG